MRETLLEDECVTEEEESFIQSFICDELEEAPSHQYSSRKDHYTSIAYTNLDEEVKLVVSPSPLHTLDSWYCWWERNAE